MFEVHVATRAATWLPATRSCDAAVVAPAPPAPGPLAAPAPPPAAAFCRNERRVRFAIINLILTCDPREFT